MPNSTQRVHVRSVISVLAVFAVLVVLALVLGLAPGRKHTSLGDNIQTVGHFGFFALFAIVVTLGVGLIPHPVVQQRGVQYVVGLGAAVVLGTLLELAQTFIPLRIASWNDLGHDTLGAVAGIASIVAWRGWRAATASERRLGCLALLVLGVSVLMGTRQFVTCARDYWYRRAAYPHLLVFAQPWTDRFLWLDEGVKLDTDRLPADWPRDAERHAAIVVFPPASDRAFPGIGVKEPYPDWRGRRSLAMDLFNPGPSTLSAGLRIHDFQHSEDYYDRFNKELALKPGFQTVRIPLAEIERGPRSRPLDLRHVDGLKLFLIRPTAPVQLAIGNFRLE